MKRTPLKRTGRLRPQSRKKASKVDARRACMEVVVRRDKRCQARDLVTEIRCGGPLDGHEPLPRSRGGDPTDPDQVVLVCRHHHSWIHNHPARSYELGLLLRTPHTNGETDE